MFSCELVEAECGCAQSKHGTKDPSAEQRHVTSGKATQREGRPGASDDRRLTDADDRRGRPTRPSRGKQRRGRLAKGNEDQEERGDHATEPRQLADVSGDFRAVPQRGRGRDRGKSGGGEEGEGKEEGKRRK